MIFYILSLVFILFVFDISIGFLNLVVLMLNKVSKLFRLALYFDF